MSPGVSGKVFPVRSCSFNDAFIGSIPVNEHASSRDPVPTLPGSRPRSQTETSSPDWQREVDRLLLERFSPSGVLVDENFNVLQFRGRTGLYFEVPPGEPTTSVLRMSRE